MGSVESKHGAALHEIEGRCGLSVMRFVHLYDNGVVDGGRGMGILTSWVVDWFVSSVA